MKVISGRVDEETWAKLKKLLKAKTNQDCLQKLIDNHRQLWKENQDLRLKVSVYKRRSK